MFHPGMPSRDPVFGLRLELGALRNWKRDTLCVSMLVTGLNPQCEQLELHG